MKRSQLAEKRRDKLKGLLKDNKDEITSMTKLARALFPTPGKEQDQMERKLYACGAAKGPALLTYADIKKIAPLLKVNPSEIFIELTQAEAKEVGGSPPTTAAPAQKRSRKRRRRSGKRTVKAGSTKTPIKEQREKHRAIGVRRRQALQDFKQAQLQTYKQMSSALAGIINVKYSDSRIRQIFTNPEVVPSVAFIASLAKAYGVDAKTLIVEESPLDDRKAIVALQVESAITALNTTNIPPAGSVRAAGRPGLPICLRQLQLGLDIQDEVHFINEGMFGQVFSIVQVGDKVVLQMKDVEIPAGKLLKLVNSLF